MTSPERTRTVLHVGCGDSRLPQLPPLFHTGWGELRLDIDPTFEPDFVASITDMAPVRSQSVDAVYSSHNLEHLYAHDVPRALAEFYRVLKPGGFLLITLPDLQQVCRHVAAGSLEDTLYESPAGPIAALDVLYGHRPALASGKPYMAHRTGFTAGTLQHKLIDAGFERIDVRQEQLALWAVGYR